MKSLGTLLTFPPLALIWIYRKLISPFLPPSCIYIPSCSEYSRQAFKKHGVFWGCYLSVHRLLRCHPFHAGGVDEVPDRVSLFRFCRTEREHT